MLWWVSAIVVGCVGLWWDLRGPNHYGNRITELLLSKLANQGGRGDEHPTAWFIAWKPHTGRMAGISHRPALCQGSAHG